MGMDLLNLARSWRSRTFDEVIGQDLVIRVLKNSLYRDYYAPVYLFSGQRGCGKTTCARLFAAALNCSALSEFKINPRHVVLPCHACASCVAFFGGNHPDIIEIDAASHTGVDNVRQIIDAASLMPVLARRRVYIIDEAHMLSKAAFNALLKILEEPPKTVLFILATTDSHKVIPTVRSRCLQLFFKAIDCELLAGHLALVCQKEAISYQPEALMMIAREAEGSARDALNALEQIRASSAAVETASVTELFGYGDQARIFELFKAVIRQDKDELFNTWTAVGVEHMSADFMWETWLAIMQDALWIAHGHRGSLLERFSSELVSLVTGKGMALISLAQFFYDAEQSFYRSRQQHRFFQVLLVRACYAQEISNGPSGLLGGSSARSQVSQENREIAHQATTLQKRTWSASGSAGVSTPLTATGKSPVESGAQHGVESLDSSQQVDGLKEIAHNNEWSSFLIALEKLDDPLLVSIFKQSSFKNYDCASRVVTIVLAKNLLLFQDWLTETRSVWEPTVVATWGAGSTCKIEIDSLVSEGGGSNSDFAITPVPTHATFVSIQPRPEPSPTQVRAHSSESRSSQNTGSNFRSSNAHPVRSVPGATRYGNSGKRAVQAQETSRPAGRQVDVSDSFLWPKTGMVVHQFPALSVEEEYGQNS